MADYSLYNALRGIEPWKQRRADEQYSLKVAMQHNQIEQQRTQEDMKSQEYMNKYLDMINQMEVLGADKKRIKAAEIEARQNIVKGISKFNGDATRFMKSGGVTMLENYKNSILQDKRVQQAMTNKSNYAAIMKAKSEGKYLHKTPVRLAVMGEDGKQMVDENGNPKFEVKRVDPLEQIQLFDQGYTDQVLFTGAEDMIDDVDYKYFLDREKNENNPYSNDIWVTGMDVMDAYKAKGASHEQALDAARRYEMDVKNGATPYQWKKKDIIDYQIKQAKLNNLNTRTAFTRAKHKAFNEQQQNRLSITQRFQDGIINDPNGMESIPTSPAFTELVQEIAGIKKLRDGNYVIPENLNVYMNDDKDGWSKSKRELNQMDPITKGRYGGLPDQMRQYLNISPKRMIDRRGNVVGQSYYASMSPEDYAQFASGPKEHRMKFNEGTGRYEAVIFVPITEQWKAATQNTFSAQMLDNAENVGKKQLGRENDLINYNLMMYNGASEMLTDD